VDDPRGTMVAYPDYRISTLQLAGDDEDPAPFVAAYSAPSGRAGERVDDRIRQADFIGVQLEPPFTLLKMPSLQPASIVD